MRAPTASWRPIAYPLQHLLREHRRRRRARAEPRRFLDHTTSKHRVGGDGFAVGGCDLYETAYQKATAFAARYGSVIQNSCTYDG